jgi:hypothetical protein
LNHEEIFVGFETGRKKNKQVLQEAEYNGAKYFELIKDHEAGFSRW